jgi:teichuronic acid exporter
VIARLLNPYDYGLMGMAGLYLNLAGYLSQAGIGDAIVALRDLTDRQIAELNSIAVVLGVALVGISCAIAFPIARFFSAPALLAVIAVSSSTCFFNAFQVVPRALLQKELQFKLIAGIETARTIVQIVTTIIFATLHFGYWSLVAGFVAASIIVTALTLLFRSNPFAVPDIALLKRELAFSRRILISRVAWYSYENADFAVAGRVLGEIPLGNYTIAWNISSAPLEKVANLVTGVTPAYFAALQSQKAELRRYLLKLTEILSLVALPASIGLALVAENLVPVFLGPKWIGAIGPLRILAFFVSFRSFATFLPNLLTAIGDAKFVMRATIFAALAMPVAFYVGSRWGTVGIACGWLVAYPMVISPVYYRVFKLTELSPKEYWNVIYPALISTLIMAAAVMSGRFVLANRLSDLHTLSVLMVTGVVAYSATLFVCFRGRVGGLLAGIKRKLLGE